MSLTLYHFSSAWGLDPSPFCAKVQSYLRLAGVPYLSAPSIFNVLRAPRGKLPFVDDNGTIIPDSHAIIAHVKRVHGDPLDIGLTPEQIAQAHMVTRMLEEGLYWVGLYSRWVEPDCWPEYRDVLFGAAPAALRVPIAAAVRADYRRRLRGLGLMRLSRDEVYDIGRRDIASIVTLLARGPFIFGEAPTSLDATIYGFLGNALYSPLESPLKSVIAGNSILASYLHRLRDRIGLPA